MNFVVRLQNLFETTVSPTQFKVGDTQSMNITFQPVSLEAIVSPTEFIIEMGKQGSPGSIIKPLLDGELNLMYDGDLEIMQAI